MLKNQASGFIVLAFLLFILWQLIDASFLTDVPLQTRHLLFMIVAAVFAMVTAWLSTTEITRQYRRLQELEKLRRDLVHMIVHDLRTPLTGMIGSLQTLRAGTLGELSQPISEFVDMSLANAQTLLAMVNDILDVSKLEASRMEVEMRKVPLNGMVRCAVRSLEPLANQKGVHLRFEPRSEEIEVLCDDDKIARVLINLIANAIKHTPNDGFITVDAAKDTEGVTVMVTDTGEGIPQEFHTKIFEKFGQVESRESGNSMSTGLGLTFCKLAVEAHHGRIWVQSTPGNGASFRFFLPSKNGHKPKALTES